MCKNIAYYRMCRCAERSRDMAVQMNGPVHGAYNITWVYNMGIIGDQLAHGVADDLNN